MQLVLEVRARIETVGDREDADEAAEEAGASRLRQLDPAHQVGLAPPRLDRGVGGGREIEPGLGEPRRPRVSSAQITPAAPT